MTTSNDTDKRELMQTRINKPMRDRWDALCEAKGLSSYAMLRLAMSEYMERNSK